MTESERIFILTMLCKACPDKKIAVGFAPYKVCEADCWIMKELNKITDGEENPDVGAM